MEFVRGGGGCAELREELTVCVAHSALTLPRENGVCTQTEIPMHKRRLCPYGARRAVRVIEFKFCCTRSVGKNPPVGESSAPLKHPICTENPCVR